MSEVILHANRNLTVRVNWPQSSSQSTLRKGRTLMPELTVFAGRPLNVAAVLGVHPTIAEDAIKSSPDIQRYKLAGFLAVGSDDPGKVNATPAAIVPAPPRAPTPVPPRSELVGRSLIDAPAALPDVPTSAPSAAAAINLPTMGDARPTIAVEETEIAPSTRWSKERLLEYAKSRGMAIDDAMTKNALIRRIRQAG